MHADCLPPSYGRCALSSAELLKFNPITVAVAIAASFESQCLGFDFASGRMDPDCSLFKQSAVFLVRMVADHRR